MFFWIIYFIFVFAGLAVAPPGDPIEGCLLLLGTVATTIFFAFQIKHYKAYRYVPGICVIGFFSYFPTLAFYGLLEIGWRILQYLTPR